MLNAEKNVVDVREEDRDFIRALTLISSEKKMLLKGILIGMGLQEEPIPNKPLVGRQMTLMEYGGTK